jgi:hypothetical protein
MSNSIKNINRKNLAVWSAEALLADDTRGGATNAAS